MAQRKAAALSMAKERKTEVWEGNDEEIRRLFTLTPDDLYFLQREQFWIDVVNCTMREATYVLDGLLYQDAPEIKEHYTDTAGYTDLIFGLFTLLGFRFAPRLRGLPDQTLYRARKGIDYGVLMPTLKKDIRVDLIAQHWDDLNRIAASLKDGLIRPSLLISKLQAKQQQNPLQQALQELGRISKTFARRGLATPLPFPVVPYSSQWVLSFYGTRTQRRFSSLTRISRAARIPLSRFWEQ